MTEKRCCVECKNIPCQVNSKVPCVQEKPSYTHTEKMDLRKKIQSSGDKFYESLSDIKELQYIAGEFMSLNEDWCILNQGTYGYIDRVSTGFSQNQKSFLERLASKVRSGMP